MAFKTSKFFPYAFKILSKECFAFGIKWHNSPSMKIVSSSLWERLRRQVLQSTSRPCRLPLATLRLKAKLFNISNDVTKDAFNEHTHERCPRDDRKIVLAEDGPRRYFSSFNCYFNCRKIQSPQRNIARSHISTSPNGLKLIDFTGARYMFVCNTAFLDRKTQNHVDHIEIDRRHFCNALDVRSIRGFNIKTDNCLSRLVRSQKVAINE